MRVLEIELYDRKRPLEDQLTAADLCQHEKSFNRLVQLRITTHRTADDAHLVKLLHACPHLQTLVIRHRWGTYKRVFDPYDIYCPAFDYSRCDPTADSLQHAGGYKIDTLTDITSILCEAIPDMCNLRHLLMDRVTWSRFSTSPPSFSLKTLLLAQSKSNFELLCCLLQNSPR